MRLHFTLVLFFAGYLLAIGQYDTDFQNVIEQYEIDNNIQGISASIHLGEHVQWQGSTGFSYADIPMDTSMLLGIASNTKLFTSTICLMMIDHGYFSLDDPLSKWLNPIALVDPSVTVKQLLQHNSGINDFITNTDLFPNQVLANPTKIWTPEETLTYIFDPIAGPGEGIYYSNANYILAAMVLESATGMKYIDLVRDSIFIPLGLEDIYFEGFEEINDSIAHPFVLGTDFASIERTALGTITWAAGGLVSKPKTLTKWYNALFSGQFVKDEILDEMLDFVAWPDDPLGNEMGLGIYRISNEDKTYYGHGGRTIGYSSYTLYDLECGHSISVVINDFFSESYALALELAIKACELVNMPSSVNEVSSISAVYPNPANNFITIEEAISAEIFDLSGRKILHSNNPSYINTAPLVNGTYFVRFKIDEELRTQKIVVEH